MSRILEREPALTKLKLWVGVDPALRRTKGYSRSERHQVVFWQVHMPGQEPDPASTLQPEELGLPRSFDEARRFRYGEPDFRLPPELAARLDTRLDEREDPQAPLWLELAQPCGTLSLVPWERLLLPALRVPIFRIPFFGIPAAVNPGSLDVVFCASSPVAKQPFDVEELLGSIIEEAIRNLPDDSNMHVFTDVRSFPELKERLGRRVGRRSSHRVFLYDPRQSAPALFKRHRRIEEDPEEQKPEERGAIQSPWLLWMLDAMGKRGVDAVHFLAHGYLAADQGALALAESPTENRDDRWARFIGPAELSTFLTRIGAWSVSMSAAPANFSILGMRLLIDQLARLRVGPVMLHDMSDGKTDALGRALRFVFGAGTPQETRALGVDERPVALYCHPSRTGSVASMEQANWYLFQHTMAGGRTGEHIRQSATLPSWLLAAQRTLERSSAELMESRQAQSGDPERLGIERALTFLSNVVDRDPESVACEPEELSPPNIQREAL